MVESKSLAVAAALLTGTVVRIELRKAGNADPDAWWLGHLDTIAELLTPSPEVRKLAAAGGRSEARATEALRQLHDYFAYGQGPHVGMQACTTPRCTPSVWKEIQRITTPFLPSASGEDQ